MESKEICNDIFEEAKESFAFTNFLMAAKFFYKEQFTIYSFFGNLWNMRGISSDGSRKLNYTTVSIYYN